MNPSRLFISPSVIFTLQHKVVPVHHHKSPLQSCHASPFHIEMVPQAHHPSPCKELFVFANPSTCTRKVGGSPRSYLVSRLGKNILPLVLIPISKMPASQAAHRVCPSGLIAKPAVLTPISLPVGLPQFLIWLRRITPSYPSGYAAAADREARASAIVNARCSAAALLLLPFPASREARHRSRFLAAEAAIRCWMWRSFCRDSYRSRRASRSAS